VDGIIAAALIGGFVGAVAVSALAAVVDWNRARQSADESQRQREHQLDVLILEQHHQMQRAAMQDAARLRDARVARLNEDAKELTRALFDLERLALLMQWGHSADRAEMERLELSARTRFESARAGLTLDPEGNRLTTMFESLTRDIAQYQSMVQSHRVLVEARAVEQVVEHADQMEAQRGKVVEGIMAALHEIQDVLKSVAAPIEAPMPPELPSRVAAAETADEDTAADRPAAPDVAPQIGLPATIAP
jgi:hypothetical protein